MSARKNDSDKWRPDLIPPEAIYALSRVLQYGAQKYEPRNWEQGLDWSRVYGATQRHLNSFWAGENIDKDSGMPHVWHALCCLAFLVHHVEHYQDRDDRPKGPAHD